MRAVCWEGKENIRVENVPDPVILNPRDAIVKVTTTAICGSDLHIDDGYIPTMQKGDVLGHEFMGEVGKETTRLKIGDRVVVPFTIACGHCYFCKEQLWSLCDNSNPNAWMFCTTPSSSRTAPRPSRHFAPMDGPSNSSRTSTAIASRSSRWGKAGSCFAPPGSTRHCPTVSRIRDSSSHRTQTRGRTISSSHSSNIGTTPEKPIRHAYEDGRLRQPT